MFALVKHLILHWAFWSHLTWANLGIDGESFRLHFQWQLSEGLWRVWEHVAERGRLETMIQITRFSLSSPSVPGTLYYIWGSRKEPYVVFRLSSLASVVGWLVWHWVLCLKKPPFTLFPLPTMGLLQWTHRRPFGWMSLIPHCITDCLSVALKTALKFRFIGHIVPSPLATVNHSQCIKLISSSGSQFVFTPCGWNKSLGELSHEIFQ